MKLLKLLGSICYLLLVSACAGVQLYDGNKQPLENIVVINGKCVHTEYFSKNWVKIHMFDGNIIEGGCHISYEFLPGEHTLTLRSGDQYQASVTKEFKAGERYKLIPNDPYFPSLIYIGKYNKLTGEVEP